MKSKNLLFYILYLLLTQFVNGQEKKEFLFTKGENNTAIITMGSLRSPHCTVFEYPDFLVIHEVPEIPSTNDTKENRLISFIDSVYSQKPIKYILNSHSHTHSLSTIMPFLKRGVKLVTTKESLKLYDKKGFFKNKSSKDYSQLIIQVSSDTLLLAETKNPIKVLHLKKPDYKSIPTPTYLLFNFQKQKLLAASCMTYLKEFDKKKGYSGTIYSDRLVDVNKIITDKKLNAENISQLYRFRYKGKVRELPIFPVSYLRDVLKYGRTRLELSNHFQKMSYEELTVKKDSLLNYLTENSIHNAILNHAIYGFIEKEEYKKAIALAQILVVYYPNRINFIDTLGEAYFNDGQIETAKHYNRLIERAKSKEELGIKIWEKNRNEKMKEK